MDERREGELPVRLRKPNLRRAAAAEYLDVVWGLTFAPETLRKWASTGIGPRFRRINRTVFYQISELDSWATQKLGPATVQPADRDRVEEFARATTIADVVRTVN